MKKILISAAVFVAAMSSCSKDEVTTSAGDNTPIGFSTYMGTATKAPVMDIDNLKKAVASSSTAKANEAGGFGVFGYMHAAKDDAAVDAAAGWASDDTKTAADFMWNQKVEYDDAASGIPTTIGKWIYSPIKYWPNDTKDRITFFAYAPYADNDTDNGGSKVIGIKVKKNSTTSGSELTSPVLDYTMQVAPANLVDLVADYKVDVAKLGASDYQNTVAFKFQHILTRADFKVKLSDEIVTDKDNSTETQVILTEVKLVGTDNTNAVDASKLFDKTGTAQNSTMLLATNTFTFNKESSMADPTGSQDVGTWHTAKNSNTPSDFNGYILQEDNYDLDGSDDSHTGTILNFKNNAVTGAENPVDNSDKYSKDDSQPDHYGVVVPNNGDAENVFIPAKAAASPNPAVAQQYLFLIPSNDDTGLETEGDIKVYLEYQIITKDANLPEGISITTNHDIVSLPANSLQAGKAYEFTFALGLHSVNVEGTVEAWGTGEDKNILTPDNVVKPD